MEIGQGLGPLGLPEPSGGLGHKGRAPPGASRTVPLAAGWRACRVCWRPRSGASGRCLRGGHDAGQLGDDPAAASGNPTPFILITSLAASPCSPHPSNATRLAGVDTRDGSHPRGTGIATRGGGRFSTPAGGRSQEGGHDSGQVDPVADRPSSRSAPMRGARIARPSNSPCWTAKTLMGE